jgi:hypothetical protein
VAVERPPTAVNTTATTAPTAVMGASSDRLERLCDMRRERLGVARRERLCVGMGVLLTINLWGREGRVGG